MKKQLMTAARNRAFISQSRRLVASGEISPYAGIDAIVEATLACRPPEFFLDEDYAVRIVSALLHRRKDCRAHSMRGALWADLIEKVEHVRQKRPLISLAGAVGFVLRYMRPEQYYICPSTARKLLRPYFRRVFDTHF